MANRIGPDRSKPEYWLGEIKRAKVKLRRVAEEQEWAKLKNLWDAGTRDIVIQNDSNHTQIGPISEGVFVNWIWPFAQTFIPAVYWRHPKIRAYPQKASAQKAAALAQSLINYGFAKTKFRKHERKALQDCLWAGHGWIKIGWHTHVGQVPASASYRLPAAESRKSTLLDYELYLDRDEPYAYRVHPQRILVDPEAADYDEARWICQIYYKPLDLVKKDPLYRYTDNISGCLFESQEGTEPIIGTDKERQREDMWCRIYELWDRDQQRVFWLCEGSSKWNRELTWPYAGIYGFPFKMLKVTEPIEQFYPVSPVLPWLSQVEELALVRSMRLDHMRRMIRKIVMPEETLSDTEMAKLLDPEEEVILAQDPERIRELAALQPDPNLYAAEERIKEDIRDISGYSEILSGSAPPRRIAATTAALMERNATIRFDDHAEMVGEHILDVARDLFKIIRTKMEYPVQIKITHDPEPEFIQIEGPKELEGEIDFSLELEDMSVSSKQQRQKESYDALVALSQFPEIKRDALVRDVLLAFGKTDLEEYMQPPAGPPVDPQFENMLMSRGVPVEPNPNEDFRLHLQVHNTFMQGEGFFKMVASLPHVKMLFSEHVQRTLRMAEFVQMQQGGAGQARAGVSPSIQQGQRNMTSAPPPGAGMGQQQAAQAQAGQAMRPM